MRSSKRWRITGLSEPKAGSNFLDGISENFQITLDIDRFVTQYIAISAESMFARTCEVKLAEKTRLLVDSLQSQYDCTMEEAGANAYEPNFAYVCKYDDTRLRSLVDALLKGTRARIVISLGRINKGWLIGFCIGSDVEIAHILAATIGEALPINPRYFARAEQGKMLNPHRLKAFTLQPMPGIDRISLPSLVVPSKYTVEQRDCIEIGSIVHPATGQAVVPALLSISRILGHVGIFATTGAGKTNLSFRIIEQLVTTGKTVLVLDTKRDYTSLSKKGFVIYGFGHGNLFRYNPLKPPPGTDPATWAKTIAHVMAESISGSIFASGAFSIFMELVNQLYTERGIYDGGTAYPTIFDLLEQLDAYAQRTTLSQRQRDWLTSAMKLFKSLSVGPTSEAFSVREGISIANILGQNAVIELDGLGDQSAKNFFVSAMLEGIKGIRIARNERDMLQHIIVIEEAHNYLAKREEASSTLTATYREIRSLCEGIIAITQMPSEFSKDALANTNTLFVLKLIHPEDKRIMCDILGIPYAQAPLIEGLEVGTCLMKADEMCMVRIPLVHKEAVTEEEIRIAPQPRREEVATNFASRTDAANRAVHLSEREWLVLKLIGESTAYNNSTLMEATHYSNAEISKVIHKLINAGFVRYCQVKKQGVGRRQNVYFLFPYGEEAYRLRYNCYPDRSRTMRAAQQSHSDMKEKVIAYLGIQPEPHGRFDIYYSAANGMAAIELETGSNNSGQIYTNVQKSVEEIGTAQFVVADDIVYYAVLQQAGRYHYDAKRDFTLKIALFDIFLRTGCWDTFSFQVAR